MIQGSVVVLQNGDGRILAETGGRQIFNGRSASYSDYNRVTQALRQPGSAMKPIVSSRGVSARRLHARDAGARRTDQRFTMEKHAR